MELKIDAILSTMRFEHFVRETSLRTPSPLGEACVISDIVKRRLIRVWDLQSNLRNLIHNLQDISAPAHGIHRKMSDVGGL